MQCRALMPPTDLVALPDNFGKKEESPELAVRAFSAALRCWWEAACYLC